jgi:GNAT superfamily N-acetyltransferase
MRDGKRWDSIAVLPEYRRLGYGKAALRFTIRMVDGDVWSMVREDNASAAIIHDVWDWEFMGKDGNMLCYRTHEERI